MYEKQYGIEDFILHLARSDLYVDRAKLEIRIEMDLDRSATGSLLVPRYASCSIHRDYREIEETEGSKFYFVGPYVSGPIPRP